MQHLFLLELGKKDLDLVQKQDNNSNAEEGEVLSYYLNEVRLIHLVIKGVRPSIMVI